MFVPTRTKREFYQDNRDEILERRKEYYQREDVKERTKEYKQREDFKKQQREYKNREDVKQKRKERIKCPTSQKEMNWGSLYLHNKTQHKDS